MIQCKLFIDQHFVIWQLQVYLINLYILVYVDHEPFNKAIVPNLCRLFTETKPISKSV